MAKSGSGGSERAKGWPKLDLTASRPPPDATDKTAVNSLFRLAKTVCGQDRERAHLRVQRTRERGRLEPIAPRPGPEAPPLEAILVAAQAATAVGGAAAGLDETRGGSSGSRCEGRGRELDAEAAEEPPAGPPGSAGSSRTLPPIASDPSQPDAQRPGSGSCPAQASDGSPVRGSAAPLEQTIGPCQGLARAAEPPAKPRKKKAKEALIRASLQRFRRGLTKQEPILGELRNLQEVVRALVPVQKEHKDLSSLREAYRETLTKQEGVDFDKEESDDDEPDLVACAACVNSQSVTTLESTAAGTMGGRLGSARSINTAGSTSRSTRGICTASSIGSFRRPSTLRNAVGSLLVTLDHEDKALLNDWLELQASEQELNARREVRASSAKRTVPKLDEAEPPQAPQSARLARTTTTSFASTPRHRTKRTLRSATTSGLGDPHNSSIMSSASRDALPMEDSVESHERLPNRLQAAGLPALATSGSKAAQSSGSALPNASLPWGAGTSGSEQRRSLPRTPRSQAEADSFIFPSATPPKQAKTLKQEPPKSPGRQFRGRPFKAKVRRRSAESSSSSASDADNYSGFCDSESNDGSSDIANRVGNLAASCLKKVKYPSDPIFDDPAKPVSIQARKSIKHADGSARESSTFSTWLSKQPWHRPSVNILKILQDEESD